MVLSGRPMPDVLDYDDLEMNRYVMALAVAGGPLNLRAVRPNIALNRTSVRRPSFCGLGTRRLI